MFIIISIHIYVFHCMISSMVQIRENRTLENNGSTKTNFTFAFYS